MIMEIACLEKRCGCHSHNGFVILRNLPFGRGLAEDDMQLYLDKVASVSGSRRDEITMIFDDEVIDDQHRRFLQEVAYAGEEVS